MKEYRIMQRGFLGSGSLLLLVFISSWPFTVKEEGSMDVDQRFVKQL